MQEVIKKLNRYFEQFEFAVFNGQSRWIVEAVEKNLNYLKAMNAQGNHIFIKPVDESCYMLCDDFNQAMLEKYHKHQGKFRPGRMIIETSPGNFQVWIRSDTALSYETKLFWLRKMKSDPGCVPKNRWGRSPGFRNRKEKYKTASGFYPLSKLIWIDWKNKAVVPSPSTQGGGVSYIPRLQEPVFKNSVSRSRYEKGNESKTDFAFALSLMRRGFTDDEIANLILNERTDWKHHQGERKQRKYFAKTLKNARGVL